jgi:hypothetical protein
MLQNCFNCPLTLYDGLLAQWRQCPLFLGVSSFGDLRHGDGSSDWGHALARGSLRLGFAALKSSAGGLSFPGGVEASRPVNTMGRTRPQFCLLPILLSFRFPA